MTRSRNNREQRLEKAPAEFRRSAGRASLAESSRASPVRLWTWVGLEWLRQLLHHERHDLTGAGFTQESRCNGHGPPSAVGVVDE